MASEEQVNNAQKLRQELDDILFLQRSFTDEALKSAKAVFESKTQATAVSKAFRGVSNASADINTALRQVINGEKSINDLQKKIEQELKGLTKLNKNSSPTVTTRLKHQITSINGEEDKSKIREFVDNYLLAQDSRALRERIKELGPDVDLTFFPEGRDRRVDIPIGLSFFWPDI